MGSHSPTLTVEAAATSMKTLLPVLAMAALMGVVAAGRRQAYTPYISPGQLFGSSAPAPCCRSSFPDEPGSCLTNEHCIQETAPYCSAFGFCTQQRQYGYSGCVACPQHTPSVSPYTPIHSVAPSIPYTAGRR